MKQLTPSFPSKEAFVAAYGHGDKPIKLTLTRPRNLDINGKFDRLNAGDVVIGFSWNYGSYRIPGVGFVHADGI